ncbi:hypothetical protein M885DRAFT_514536 [Pelagophyceae sp. CCMP2097]|nr:hypothetical protein M885DRAFT_514536 [Pelagophyceae sp. CCMP2097]|mmetsp:Transcript_8025/g.28134  ORF Transcript_8025/g.28134 Transcript_8025/m.28134 type:complete len:336 (+) Transcript_8025:1322-2329(+)
MLQKDEARKMQSAKFALTGQLESVEASARRLDAESRRLRAQAQGRAFAALEDIEGGLSDAEIQRRMELDVEFRNFVTTNGLDAVNGFDAVNGLVHGPNAEPAAEYSKAEADAQESPGDAACDEPEKAPPRAADAAAPVDVFFVSGDDAASARPDSDSDSDVDEKAAPISPHGERARAQTASGPCRDPVSWATFQNNDQWNGWRQAMFGDAAALPRIATARAAVSRAAVPVEVSPRSKRQMNSSKKSQRHLDVSKSSDSFFRPRARTAGNGKRPPVRIRLPKEHLLKELPDAARPSRTQRRDVASWDVAPTSTTPPARHDAVVRVSWDVAPTSRAQ